MITREKSKGKVKFEEEDVRSENEDEWVRGRIRKEMLNERFCHGKGQREGITRVERTGQTGSSGVGAGLAPPSAIGYCRHHCDTQ